MIDWSEGLHEELLAMRAKGLSLDECAEQLGVGYHTLRKHCRDTGVSTRYLNGVKNVRQYHSNVIKTWAKTRSAELGKCNAGASSRLADYSTSADEPA